MVTKFYGVVPTCLPALKLHIMYRKQSCRLFLAVPWDLAASLAMHHNIKDSTHTHMETVVRSYKNLARNMVSHKIRSFLMQIKIFCEVILNSCKSKGLYTHSSVLGPVPCDMGTHVCLCCNGHACLRCYAMWGNKHVLTNTCTCTCRRQSPRDWLACILVAFTLTQSAVVQNLWQSYTTSCQNFTRQMSYALNGSSALQHFKLGNTIWII